MSAVVTAWAALTAAGEGAPGEPLWGELDGLTCSRAPVAIRALWPSAPERVGRMDRASAHALLVAHRALSRAGFGGSAPAELAVVVGTSLGCAEVNERYHRALVERGAEGASPILFAQTIPSAPAGEVAIALGARGFATTVMAGRCSGVAALVAARRALALGRADSALVIAGDTLGPDRVHLRASRGEPPCAEAMVALVVERSEVARDAGRRALAVIERADVTGGAEGDDASVDWMGASGLMELVAWLDRGSAESFQHEVRCASGRVGRLRARR